MFIQIKYTPQINTAIVLFHQEQMAAIEVQVAIQGITDISTIDMVVGMVVIMVPKVK